MQNRNSGLNAESQSVRQSAVVSILVDEAAVYDDAPASPISSTVSCCLLGQTAYIILA